MSKPETSYLQYSKHSVSSVVAVVADLLTSQSKVVGAWYAVSLDFPQESDSGEVTRHSVALSPQHARSTLFSPLFRKRLSITKPVLL